MDLARIRSRYAATMLAAAVAILAPVLRADAAEDIVGYFKQYYQQQVLGNSYKGPLDFLQNSAAQHLSADQVLVTSKARAVIEDRRNGYLQISDSSDTDETLTMATYRRADGSSLLVVGSSDCADGCSFAVEFFTPSGGRLDPVAAERVVPTIPSAEFIKPGSHAPKEIGLTDPEINYVPARVGTSLKLSPWYGYEAEEQMEEAKTRSAVRDVVLSWDKSQGRFVESKP